MGDIVSMQAAKRRIGEPHGLIYVNPFLDEENCICRVTMYYDCKRRIAFASYNIVVQEKKDALMTFEQVVLPEIKRKEKLYRDTGTFDEYN